MEACGVEAVSGVWRVVARGWAGASYLSPILGEGYIDIGRYLLGIPSLPMTNFDVNLSFIIYKLQATSFEDSIESVLQQTIYNYTSTTL